MTAVFFLTALPQFKFKSNLTTGEAILYFPLVGVLLGLMLTGVDWLGSQYLSNELRALMDVAFLVLITGGLHLDGLSDSADALYFTHNKEKALKIMKDPRVGVMGVLALVFCLAFKFTGILDLNVDHCWIWFVIALGLGRSAQVMGLVFMVDAREEGGSFREMYKNKKYGYLAFCLIPLALPFAIDPIIGVTVLAGFILICSSLFMFFHIRLGGMTGDTLGASTEIIETFFLMAGGLCL